jgi:hypothetical protein
MGYYQLDGCPNCGFGYGSNHHDNDVFGVGAWIDYGRHILSCQHIEPSTDEFYERSMVELHKRSDEEVRQLVFEWSEKQERCDDVYKTVFVYSNEDVENYLATNPTIFKTIENA